MATTFRRALTGSDEKHSHPQRHVFDRENKYGESNWKRFDPPPNKPSAAATTAKSILMQPAGRCCSESLSVAGWSWRKSGWQPQSIWKAGLAAT